MPPPKQLGFRKALSLLRRTAEYMGPMRKTYFLGVLLTLSEMGALFAAPVLNRQLVLLVTKEAEENTVRFAVILFFLLLVLAPAAALGKYLQGIGSSYGAKELRRGVFAHLQNLSLAEAGENRTGDMVTRLTNDTERTASVFQSFAIVSLIRFVSVLSVSLALLLITDWRIALISLAYNGVCFLLAVQLNPYVRRLERDAREQVSVSANFLLEALRGRSIIRLFLLTEILGRKFEALCRQIMKRRIKFRFMNGLSYGTIDLFVFSAQAVAFLLGISFGLKAGQDLAVNVYAASLMGVMANATLSGSSFLLLIQPSLVAASRVFEILDKKPELDRPSTVTPGLNHDLAVDIRDLTFIYPDGTKALDRVSLQISRGEHIVLAGSSGSGKSTLVKLLEALYEPAEGSITLFGAPTARLSLGDIRALSSYVPQECTVFDDTIGVNIGYGKPGASREEIVAAARTAGIHDFIQSLPNGYETLIGEQGSQISGGQRQRIAIARAVLKGAPLLLLDEPASSLDSTTEGEIYKNLKPLMDKATVITIAHRLNTVKDADRIIVFEKGRIVEEGSHRELLALGGYYKNFYKTNRFQNE
ncbi:MAG: ABC transporter ATP-binding protein/permease [Treponema sp.]|jgi:ABC-type multidrug transport system fused ATPase/permease subunit|nr:ABC transporter ATP-binding protein/permease [Treponema sp.]